MARRRMFSLDVIDTDRFLDMPSSTQNLYFHLGMRADDEGFVASPRRVQKNVNATEDDMKILIAKEFIIPFETGVCVVTHWKMHNYIQNDRSKPTIYLQERSKLVAEEGVYLLTNGRIQSVSSSDTQDRLGEGREGKDRKEGSASGFTKPTLEEITEYCKERGNNVDPQRWMDHYSSNGWKVGKNSMKDWRAAVRTWERSEYSKPSKQPIDLFSETPSNVTAMSDRDRRGVELSQRQEAERQAARTR